MQSIKPPLSGIRVLDFSELLPGPFFTQNLADLGAEVTKIERPPHGDNARRIAPGLFASVNRGKHSIMRDLKDPASANAVRGMVEETDIVVEGFRPGVMQRLGFDYQALRAINPGLVYVSLSGYGQTGPLAQLPGHDINYLAMAGILALSGSDPTKPDHGAGIPLADLCGAMYALSSTLAALLQRQHTGAGQYLDVSLTDCAMHWMNPRLGHFRAAGLHSLEQQRQDILAKPAYGVFPTADKKLLCIAALEDHFWSRLNETLGLHLSCETYNTHAGRAADAALINQRIAKRTATFAAGELLALLAAADVPVSPVAQPAELHEAEHSISRRLFSGETTPGFVRYPVPMPGVESRL